MTDRPAGTPDEPTPDEPEGTEPGVEAIDEEIVEAEAEDIAAAGDADHADDEVLEGDDTALAATAAGGAVAEAPATGRRGRAAVTPTGRTATPGEAAVRSRDNISKWFVAITAIVFALILLNGVFLGRNGVFSPKPAASESPAVSASPATSPIASPAISASPEPSVSAAPSVSASPSASPAGSGSPAPS